MQGMTMTPAALAAAQMAAAQSGQLPKANSAQLQQQLVAGAVAPGSMAMPAVSAPAGVMQGKMGTPVRPANMQPMVAGAMPHAGGSCGCGQCKSLVVGEGELTSCRVWQQHSSMISCPT